MQEQEPQLSYSVEPNNRVDSTFITPDDIKRFIKRYTGTIAISTLIGLLAAVAYSYSAVPLYTARTQIIIDPSLPQVLRDANTDTAFTIDNAQIESQLEVLRSDKIAIAVIDQLKLQNVPEFNGADGGYSPFSSAAPTTPDAVQRMALGRYQSNLYVRRVGVSYAIEILYGSKDPALAAKIANATAEAYIQEQFSARAQTASRSIIWLEERIDGLRAQMNDAALNAQEFRAKRDYRITPANDSTIASPDNSTAVSAKEAAAKRQITIEELDSTAQTYRRIYESYLGAYAESVQKQSYPVTNARIITAASPLVGKSHPKTKLILALGGFAGFCVGFGLAFFLHSIDRSVASARQVREEIGVECLASVPLLADVKPGVVFTSRLRKSGPARLVKSALDRQPIVLVGLSKLMMAVNTRAALMLQGRLARQAMIRESEGAASATLADTDRLNAAVTMPFSGFSHGIKTWKTAVALAGRSRPLRSLAVTSALPNEGKTTLSSNLAALYASSGTRVLLVDGDLRTGRLSRSWAPQATLGLIDAIEGAVDLEQCIVKHECGLHILPAGDSAAAHSDELLGSHKAQALLKELLTTYEFIIIELPPLVASVDGLAMSSLLDATVVVAEWGKTPVPVLSEAIHLLRTSRAKILGIVINKVDTSIIRYGDAAGNYLSYWPPATIPLRRSA